jgi:hypothetical protein
MVEIGLFVLLGVPKRKKLCEKAPRDVEAP